MTWFSWSTKGDADSSTPSRENRQKCWETRDAYFVCLDRVGVVKPGEEGSAFCREEKKVYEGNCAKSWIEYFNQRRVIADAQKERLGRANEQFRDSK